MDWTTLLFSFNGRINRAKYWLAVLIYMVVWTAFIAGCLIWLGGMSIDNLLSFAGTALLLWLIGVILLVAGTWSGLAVGVKRLHDRDKSGWWILLYWLGPSILGGWQTATPDLGGGFIFCWPPRPSRSGLLSTSAAYPARPVRTNTVPIRSAIRPTRPAADIDQSCVRDHIPDRERSRRPEVERWTGISSSVSRAASIARRFWRVMLYGFVVRLY